MKHSILLLALFFKLSIMNAGTCGAWFNISNPNPVNHSVHGLHDTILVVLNPLDSNLIFDLYHSGSGCSTGFPYQNLQWFKNGIPITGGLHLVNAGAGIYSFSCAFNGVNSMTVTIIVTSTGAATGIHESKDGSASAIHVFPNPSASGLFNLENELTEKNCAITIYNLNGQCVKKQVFDQPSGVLDLSNCERGFYFLEFTFGNGMKSHQKIIYD